MCDGKSSRMEYARQLCRRLRPILGPRMDEVFTAYCAEDPDGKQQLETYLELLSAKHLPQGLDDSEPGLIPPSQEQAQGEYPIGQVSYSGKSLYPFGLRENEWIQHMAILGRSGSGKTNIGFSILQTLVQHQKPFLVFDWKRNYRDLLTRPEFRHVEVCTIGRNIAPLTFNPLIPPAGTDPKTWLKKLNEVIAHAYCLGNGVLFLLQQAVDAVYEEAHHILSGQRTSLTGSESVMDTTYREIREFGVSLVLLDQMPSKLSGFALANSYATICMSMSNRADINAMTQTLLLDSGKDVLGTLEVGQAVVKLQGRIPRPFLVSIPEFSIQKGRVTDEQIRGYMKGKIPQLGTEDRVTDNTPAQEEGPIEDDADDSSSHLEIAFLQDVADHADSGVAARYKRLGLSGRQGQKLKTKLIDQGVVQEQLETTHTGRRMTIRLTEKGEQMLSQARKAG